MPVAASATAAKFSTFFIVSTHLVFAPAPCRNVWKLLGLRFRGLLRLQLECQLVDLAGELERNIVAILD